MKVSQCKASITQILLHGSNLRVFSDFEVVLLFLLLDPVEGLLLGVDAQWEPAGSGGQVAVLHRQLIRGETL